MYKTYAARRACTIRERVRKESVARGERVAGSRRQNRRIRSTIIHARTHETKGGGGRLLVFMERARAAPPRQSSVRVSPARIRTRARVYRARTTVLRETTGEEAWRHEGSAKGDRREKKYIYWLAVRRHTFAINARAYGRPSPRHLTFPKRKIKN